MKILLGLIRVAAFSCWICSKQCFLRKGRMRYNRGQLALFSQSNTSFCTAHFILDNAFINVYAYWDWTLSLGFSIDLFYHISGFKNVLLLLLFLFLQVIGSVFLMLAAQLQRRNRKAQNSKKKRMAERDEMYWEIRMMQNYQKKSYTTVLRNTSKGTEGQNYQNEAWIVWLQFPYYFLFILSLFDLFLLNSSSVLALNMTLEKRRKWARSSPPSWSHI